MLCESGRELAQLVLTMAASKCPRSCHGSMQGPPNGLADEFDELFGQQIDKALPKVQLLRDSNAKLSLRVNEPGRRNFQRP